MRGNKSKRSQNGKDEHLNQIGFFFLKGKENADARAQNNHDNGVHLFIKRRTKKKERKETKMDP